MPISVTIHNRQRTRAVDTRRLRQLICCLLTELLEVPRAELGLNLVGTSEMIRVNEQFLEHQGSTDVITFDHTSGDPPPEAGNQKSAVKPPTSDLRPLNLHGELFICVDEALIQARRFRTTWQAELVRYMIHGLLHLRCFDDRHATARRLMKREENRLLRELARRFDLKKLARTRRSRAA